VNWVVQPDAASRRGFFRGCLFRLIPFSRKSIGSVGHRRAFLRRFKTNNTVASIAVSQGRVRGGSHLPHSLLLTYTILVQKIIAVNTKIMILWIL